MFTSYKGGFFSFPECKLKDMIDNSIKYIYDYNIGENRHKYRSQSGVNIDGKRQRRLLQE